MDAEDDRPILYLDDLNVGDTFESGGITVTEAAIIEFAKQYDPQSFHTDPEAAKSTFFGSLAASGWHTAAMSMSLVVTQGPRFEGGMIGAGGELNWPSPTRPGDRLRIRATVLEVSRSKSRPDRGSVVLRIETLNQDDEVRQVFTPKTILFARPQT
jgi:acyl dehydratase